MGDFDFQVIINSLPFLWQGLQLSLWLTFLAIIGGLAFGTLLALARLSGIRTLAFVAAGYVNLIRSIPLILVIFWFYFLVPLALGRPVGGFQSALIAFVMFEAAYYSEIMRAGIQSVRKGQVHAGQASGLGYWQIQRYIVLPQGISQHDPDSGDPGHHPVSGYVAGVCGQSARLHDRFINRGPDRRASCRNVSVCGTCLLCNLFCGLHAGPLPERSDGHVTSEHLK